MDLLSIGSANQYAKHVALKTQWNLKKQSGDFTGHKKSLGDYVNVTKAASVLPQTDEADEKMSAIMTKAQAGRKLSHDEWEYLRTKNPVMYEKLREIEREQEQYEEELKHCKTKDEAQRLHLSKLGEILSAAKHGDESALWRLNRMTRTMTDFTQSEAYHDMPTEAEEAIEREAARIEAEIRRTQSDAAQESVADNEKEPATDTEKESVADADKEPVSDTDPKPMPGVNSGPVADTKAVSVPDRHTQHKSKPVEAAETASVRLFGERAYVNQRDRVARRRNFHAEA